MKIVGSSLEAEIRSIKHPIICSNAVVNDPHEIPFHSHPRGQLLFSINKTIFVNIEDKSWYIYPSQAVWIPSNLTHSVTAKIGADYCSIYTEEFISDALKKKPGIYKLSPLLKQLIFESASFGKDYQNGSPECRLNNVILDQLDRLTISQNELILPYSKSLVKLCDKNISNPMDRTSLKDWGDLIGATERNLSRKFKLETGMSYSQWRHRFDCNYLLEQSFQGKSFSFIASDLGYSSTNSLSRMVKNETGLTPSDFIKSFQHIQNV